ncbi:MAG: chromosome segregation protein SMC [Euryarchaeota archaeon]|nr:chromosome segregation protein SMC [Euryarchaeota archaeon]MDE1836236.1 chromosome segregation protein SMC [Euryarchaeota archaeon]MDE1880889.1 chromosome segregation protein SMC [Euryarchaeota archaeon]MDE2045003.1 chromosome segregation protein SMC [Thermoplasmata archaeon]
MHLTHLRMKNFKSFAGTVEIPFTNGFTGVAGPNGMGKSNVADAILFVLGPRSSKVLRADRLSDLLFNGGASKKAATECEVSLVFDNRDRALPVESDSVEITRYIKLTPGDPPYSSYFYVNDRRSTQTEIEALLSHARLSGDGSNIVQQGDVNRIVAMSPLERRGEVEKLAGIAQYDEELDHAADKREGLEQNLGQLQTLLTEVQRHLDELQGQREGALKFKDLDTQKRRYSSQLARATISRARGEVASLEKRLSDLKGEVDALTASGNELTQEHDRLQAEIDGIDAEVAHQGGAEAAKLKQETDELSVEVGRRQTAAEKAEESLNELTERKGELEKELAGRRKELQANEKQLAELNGRLEDLQKEIDVHHKALLEAHKATDASQGKAAQYRRAVLENERRQKSKQEDWQEAVQKLESLKGELTTFEHDEAGAEEEAKLKEVEVRDLQFRFKGVQGARKGTERSSQELSEELEAFQKKEKDLHARASSLQEELVELHRAYASLEALVRDRGTGAASRLAAVDHLLSLRDTGKVQGIRGTVEELASFDNQFATALTVAAGTRFQALVVESDEVAAKCVQILRNEKKGVATFLPLNKIVPGRPHGKSLLVQKTPGCRGFAIDLVKYEDALAPAFWYVFGETLVFDGLNQARAQMGGVRLVTMDGDLIESAGAITGGYLAAERGKGTNLQVDLRRRGEELRKKSAEEEQVRKELDGVIQHLRELTEELGKHTAEAESHETSLSTLEKDLAKAKEALDAAQEKLKGSRERRAQTAKKVEQAQTLLTELQGEIETLKADWEKAQAVYLQALPQNAAARLKELTESGEAYNQKLVDLQSQVSALDSTVKSAKATLAEKEAEVSGLEDRLPVLTRELKVAKKAHVEGLQKLEALRAVGEKQSKASKALTEKRNALQTDLTELVGKQGSNSSTITSKNDQAHDLDVKLSTAQVELSNLEAASADLPMEEADEAAAKVEKLSPTELTRRLKDVEEKLTALGPVNAAALEQYDAEKQRLEDFQGQVDRLHGEKKDLLHLIDDLNDKKRTRIHEVVEVVAKGYSEIYTELSGGGEGEVVLENPEDPLAGGLLIRAKPLGKKVQRLEQLSGGEKSLASLAFIFSLQHYDPSPLYVLDEVDMSLDGVNAENIGRMVRRNSARAQFIVISLRKVTLKWAEHLLGVTMHGDGCSRLVSIRLDDIKDVDEKELRAIAASPSALAAMRPPELRAATAARVSVSGGLAAASPASSPSPGAPSSKGATAGATAGRRRGGTKAASPEGPVVDHAPATEAAPPLATPPPGGP